MLHEQLAAARERLVRAPASIPTAAAIDVDLFARTILGWDRARLLTESQRARRLTRSSRRSREWIVAGARREPTAYIVGDREFWGLDFLVTPAVLIPRPETEFIVEEALAILTARSSWTSPRIADIGTGSGNIAVTSRMKRRRRTHRRPPTCRATRSTVAARQRGAHGVADRDRRSSRRRISTASTAPSI